MTRGRQLVFGSIKLRRDLASNWTSINPVLADGELGFEKDATPPRFKIGNGSTAWNALSYVNTTQPPQSTVDAGVSGLASGTPVLTLKGGGNATTSVQLLLKNEREGSYAGVQPYEAEVHLRFQAGITTNFRRYLNFADYTGVDRWLTGVNAQNVWIMHDSSTGGGHRLWFESTAGTAPNNTGNSYFSATGSGAVVVNGGNNDGDTLGTGGFRVDAGGTYPRQVLFKVSPYTATDAALQARNNGTGYAPASLYLQAVQSSTRGSGVFSRNDPAQASWFSGIPYNNAGLRWGIHYASQATWDPVVADSASEVLGLSTTGDLTLKRTVRTIPVTVSSLPSAATAGAGARAYVTDSTAAFTSANVASVVTGGGANGAPVLSNGTNWVIG